MHPVNLFKLCDCISNTIRIRNVERTSWNPAEHCRLTLMALQRLLITSLNIQKNWFLFSIKSNVWHYYEQKPPKTKVYLLGKCCCYFWCNTFCSEYTPHKVPIDLWTLLVRVYFFLLWYFCSSSDYVYGNWIFGLKLIYWYICIDGFDGV